MDVEALQRGRKQQAFLKGITDKSISADTLSNPTKIASMAYGMRTVRTGDIQFFSAPAGGAARSGDGQAILTVDEEAQSEIQEALADDTVDEYAEQSEDAPL